MILRKLRRRLQGDYPCARLVEAVTEYVEGSMSERERGRFERHLAACSSCQEYLAQLRRTIELTGRLSVDDVEALPAPAREALLETFRKFHISRSS